MSHIEPLPPCTIQKANWLRVKEEGNNKKAWVIKSKGKGRAVYMTMTLFNVKGYLIETCWLEILSTVALS